MIFDNEVNRNLLHLLQVFFYARTLATTSRTNRYGARIDWRSALLLDHITKPLLPFTIDDQNVTNPFIAKRRVQFRDTDAAGIMHFSTFITYMEESEHELLRSVGLSVMDCEVDGIHISWPRVSVHCDFTKPLRFEEEFEVHVHVAKLGGKSATYQFEFFKNDQSLATGSITAVCCTMAEGKLNGIRIPDLVREKLTPYIKS